MKATANSTFGTRRLLKIFCVSLIFIGPAAAVVIGQEPSSSTEKSAQAESKQAAVDSEPKAGSEPNEPTGPVSTDSTAPISPLPEEERSIQDKINDVAGWMNGHVESVFFYDISFGLLGEGVAIPLAVAWLVLGSIFFTLRFMFINVRAFGHAIQVTMGKYDNPDNEGEVSHFQALSAALSATVGLGNIGGVAIAVATGGPGATFWMIVAGLIGMSSKFAECTLGQMYRKTRPDGRVMGGAMYYLWDGLAEIGIAPVGKVLAVFFAVLCVGGSLAGGNAFQVSQSLNAIQAAFKDAPAEPGAAVEESFLETYPAAYGIAMTIAVAVVIIGGIRRIAAAAGKIVPVMCGVYVAACLYILISHAADVPNAFKTIFESAFTMKAGFGGFLGVLIVGFQRAAFSNEAGVGSAAIAHSAAKTDHPVREGIVALLEPFIDTVIVCTMTALVIVITGAYENPAYEEMRVAQEGAALTSAAMSESLWWFKYVLAFAAMMFAYSTLISWSYYGERCWCWMFGDASSIAYKLLFLVFVFLGSVVSATNILAFGDLMILGMALPNILGVLLLSGKVKRSLDEYWAKLKAGEFQVFN